MSVIWTKNPRQWRFRPTEEELIINVATATVLRPGVDEASTKPNSLVKMKWCVESTHGKLSDKPLLAVVRIHGGMITYKNLMRRYRRQETHVYDVSGLTQQVFPYGSLAAQQGYAGSHWAGRATRVIEWEGR